MTAAASAGRFASAQHCDGTNPDPDWPVETIEIRALNLAGSPRLSGEDVQHTKLLAEVHESLPPVIVHGPTMRVLDGLHRVRVAILHGETSVRARLFPGSEDDAFVLAVESNMSHGLPLTMADRTAAAQRIIFSHPQWSDRAIAVKTGLAAKTVAALRACAVADIPQLHSRVGRDGRIRPLDTQHGRRMASELITKNPGASLREIAKVAGISPGTVRDVRNRMLRNEDPVPTRSNPRVGSCRGRIDHSGRRGREERSVQRTSFGEVMATVKALQRDPSLRLTPVARFLLQVLALNNISAEAWRDLVISVPERWSDRVAEAAQEYSLAWYEFAERVRDRQSPALPEEPNGTLAV
jgi:hypothetical protein